MSSETNKATVIRYFLVSHNAPYDLTVLDETCSPEYAARMKEWLRMEGAAFPDKHFAIEDAVAEGEKVSIRWAFKGTHTGSADLPSPAGPVPPTGRALAFSAIAIYTLRDRRIVDEQIAIDWLDVLRQLGAEVRLPSGASRAG